MTDVIVLENAEELTIWEAHATAVRTAEEYSAAAERIKALDAYLLKVHAYWDPTVATAHQHHGDLVAKRTAFLVPAEVEKKEQRAAMVTWRREEDARVARVQKAADLAAQQAAEAEALRHAAALEQEAQATGNRALQAEAERVVEEAASGQMITPPVSVATRVPKIAGGPVFAKRLVIEVQDPKKLIRAIAAQTLLEAVPSFVAEAAAVHAITTFLRQFAPPSDSRLHYLEVSTANMRRDATGRGDDYIKLPGVLVERRES